MKRADKWRLAVFVGCAIVLAAGAAVTLWPSGAATAGPQNEAMLFDPDMAISDGGLSLVMKYADPVRDPASLQELRATIATQGQRTVAALTKKLADLQESPDSPKRAAQESTIHRDLGSAWTYEGEIQRAIDEYTEALERAEAGAMPKSEKLKLIAALGVLALRKGETENCIACVGPSSCILPIQHEAVHANQAGSRAAIKRFNEYLAIAPDDLRIRWLLNVAHMTLGEYPDKVPEAFRISIDSMQSQANFQRFTNVAPLVGLTSRGPNQAGGSIFDDFDGDGLPDIFSTSIDVDRGPSLFINRGDGTFEDRSDAAGLSTQVFALNAVQADFDNDGNLDVLLLRGGWMRPMRMTLLRNKGKGVFEDVTVAAGLGEPIATEAAAWGDFDGDGLIDLFVCGEYLTPAGDSRPDEVASRLYRNLGNGKFEDVTAKAGISILQCAKGCAWADFDGDGKLDLFVSNMTGPNCLYRNLGDGVFEDVAMQSRVAAERRGFACWAWDFDNDGRPDIFVNDYFASLTDLVADAAGLPPTRKSRPRLYRNMGGGTFRDVAEEVGLNRPILSMGCNFGDLDNDGFLDIYFGTGNMGLEHLVPNRLFRNDGGKSFLDVTFASGTGHLQKGHGISMADANGDGFLDVFVEAGAAGAGDRSFNLLFENPGNANHWLKVKLVGVRTNRAAIGARVKATVIGADGTPRHVYRTVGNNSSFGGNTLMVHLGLGEATKVTELEVSWPVGPSTQVFRDIAADRTLEITEGAKSYREMPQQKVARHAPKTGM